MALLYESITKEIIGAAFEVYNHLGYGFLEKVYQRAMKVELNLRGLACELEDPVEVYYKEKLVGDFRSDLFVEKKVITEIKVSPQYVKADEAQLLNELKATGIKVGMLINFGKAKVEFSRFVN